VRSKKSQLNDDLLGEMESGLTWKQVIPKEQEINLANQAYRKLQS
jgi:hypothetical protein